jgi:ABC-type branched-subunit amino acid transport system substrate-binding protein
MEEKFKAAGVDNPVAMGVMPIFWIPLKFLNQAMINIGPDLTREKLVTELENIKDFDTGGLGKIQFGPGLRKGTHYYKILQANAAKGIFNPVTDWREPSLKWGQR